MAHVIWLFAPRGTIASGECDGIRMREPGETVHVRAGAEDNPICSKCGKYAAVWVSYIKEWERRPQRCKAED